MNTKITIVLADDHTLMRDALSKILENYAEFLIIGKVSNGKQLIEFLKETKTDVILLDMQMPVMSGTTALELITERYKQIKVIMLGDYHQVERISQCVSMGASGFLTKSCNIGDLRHCILQVMEKGFYLDEKTANDVLNYSQAAKSGQVKSPLSEREKEIIKELCTGKSEKDIAVKLHISHNTVHKHREKIYRKTNSHNLADIIFYAIKNEILLLA